MLWRQTRKLASVILPPLQDVHIPVCHGFRQVSSHLTPLLHTLFLDTPEHFIVRGHIFKIRGDSTAVNGSSSRTTHSAMLFLSSSGENAVAVTADSADLRKDKIGYQSRSRCSGSRIEETQRERTETHPSRDSAPAGVGNTSAWWLWR
jgi:hypothetical protein